MSSKPHVADVAMEIAACASKFGGIMRETC